MANEARVNRALRRLGLGGLETGRVEAFMAADAEAAAELVRQALERFLIQLQSNSVSKVLEGYDAVKETGRTKKSKSSIRLRLQRSGVQLTGKFEWVVYVKAPEGASGYDDKDFNLFDILSKGRPKYENPSGKAIPLFGAGSNRLQTRVGGKGGASIAKAGRVARVKGKKVARRDSALRKGYSHGYDPDKEVILFTKGPIAKVPAQFLYERALKQAKDDLSGSGFKDWDVIYVGPLGK